MHQDVVLDGLIEKLLEGRRELVHPKGRSASVPRTWRAASFPGMDFRRKTLGKDPRHTHVKIARCCRVSFPLGDLMPMVPVALGVASVQ
jgi:hypothetical protein